MGISHALGLHWLFVWQWFTNEWYPYQIVMESQSYVKKLEYVRQVVDSTRVEDYPTEYTWDLKMDLLEYFLETEGKVKQYYWWTWGSILQPLVLWLPYDAVFFTWAGWDWYSWEGYEL